MKQNISRILLAGIFLFGLAGLAFGQAGQAAFLQTTLATQVNGPSYYNGNASTAMDGCMTLASVTGISAPLLPGTPVSVLYIGREAFGVITVNTGTKIVCGLRGYLSSQATPHPSGDMVLIAPPYNNTIVGSNASPSGLYAFDMPAFGACTTPPTTLSINVMTGAQWICSTVTKSWVPGFNNPANANPGPPTANVTWATSVTPSGPFFHMNGTATTVTTIVTPVGCDATAVGACNFSFMADTAGTLGTGGNLFITASITTVVGKVYTLIWDSANSKWFVLGS